MEGTKWGVAIALERGKNGQPSHRNARRWQSHRNHVLRQSGTAKGLSGASLHQAVMAIAMADPTLVKIEQAGA